MRTIRIGARSVGLGTRALGLDLGLLGALALDRRLGSLRLRALALELGLAGLLLGRLLLGDGLLEDVDAGERAHADVVHLGRVRHLVEEAAVRRERELVAPRAIGRERDVPEDQGAVRELVRLLEPRQRRLVPTRVVRDRPGIEEGTRLALVDVLSPGPSGREDERECDDDEGDAGVHEAGGSSTGAGERLLRPSIPARPREYAGRARPAATEAPERLAIEADGPRDTTLLRAPGRPSPAPSEAPSGLPR